MSKTALQIQFEVFKQKFVEEAKKKPITKTQFQKMYSCGDGSVRNVVDALLREKKIFEGPLTRNGKLYSTKPVVDAETKIIKAMSQKSSMTVEEIVRLSGLRRKQCHDYLTRMKSKNKVTSHGDKHKSYWKLLEVDLEAANQSGYGEVLRLKKELSTTYRGTWLQGLESVL